MEIRRLKLIIERRELFELLYDLRELCVEGYLDDIKHYEKEIREEIDYINCKIETIDYLLNI